MDDCLEGNDAKEKRSQNESVAKVYEVIEVNWV